MIVTDEAAIMKDCLINVAHLFDAVVIDYNGSGDGTAEIIRAFCQEAKIPCSVRTVPWINDFGHSRTLAIRHAEHFLGFKVSVTEVSSTDEDKLKVPDTKVPDLPRIDEKDYMSKDTRWYAFFMDADNKLCSSDAKVPFDGFKHNLGGDLITIDMTAAGVQTYDYNWMIKLDHTGVRRWKWYYPVHEYVGLVDSTQKVVPQHLKGGYIICGHEGARSRDPVKYLKDALAFERYLAAHANDPRALYYLAQSYRDARKLREAFDAFCRRGDLDNGWVQEKYVALVEAGKLCFVLYPRNPWRAIEFFLKAMETKVQRLEAVFYVVDFMRKIKLRDFGWMIAKNYVDMDYPKGALFIDDHIYQWRFYDAAGVCAYYGGAKNKGKELVKRALKPACVPEADRKRMTEDLKWYVN